MKTLFKMIVAVGLLGVLSACVMGMDQVTTTGGMIIIMGRVVIGHVQTLGIRAMAIQTIAILVIVNLLMDMVTATNSVPIARMMIKTAHFPCRIKADF